MTSRRKTWQTILLYVFIVVLCVVILYPYFVMFITALKDNKEMYSVDHIFPNTWQWSNFADIWTAALTCGTSGWYLQNDGQYKSE